MFHRHIVLAESYTCGRVHNFTYEMPKWNSPSVFRKNRVLLCVYVLVVANLTLSPSLPATKIKIIIIFAHCIRKRERLHVRWTNVNIFIAEISQRQKRRNCAVGIYWIFALHTIEVFLTHLRLMHITKKSRLISSLCGCVEIGKRNWDILVFLLETHTNTSSVEVGEGILREINYTLNIKMDATHFSPNRLGVFVWFELPTWNIAGSNRSSPMGPRSYVFMYLV